MGGRRGSTPCHNPDKWMISPSAISPLVSHDTGDFIADGFFDLIDDLAATTTYAVPGPGILANCNRMTNEPLSLTS